MSVAGSLCAFAFALFFAGLYFVLTGPRRFDGCALMAIGAASLGMAYELLSKNL